MIGLKLIQRPDADPPVRRFPRDEHVILSDGPFYRETVAGVKLVGWVSRLIEGEPVDDVGCQGAASAERPTIFRSVEATTPRPSKVRWSGGSR